MKIDDIYQKPHRRLNPLTREWILVSPQRTQRPWQGKIESANKPKQQYDPQCYLCPGNVRAERVRNPQYKETFAFDNDYPALRPLVSEDITGFANPLFAAIPEVGVCRVLCFSPRHDLTLALMSLHEVRTVVDAWAKETQAMERLDWIRYVQVFENRGALMGASNPHPHCQIWGSSSVPNLPQRELESQNGYFQANGRCLLCDYLEEEKRRSERIVCENEGFVAGVPFWALWPFEVLILSKRHVSSLSELTPEERNQFADVVRRVTIRYDNLFETSFPYSMGLHQRPSGAGDFEAWHFHVHFFPPLLRSATVQKFMVGYELLATPQRDISPEDAATRLASLSETHYLGRR
jgi:UDPglucose--hexose-1-phosphate uridylyltransferase